MISIRQSIRRFVTGYATPHEKSAFILGYVVSGCVSGMLIIAIHFIAEII